MATMATQAKSHTVRVDVLMDVLSVLFNNDIPFRVEGINEHEDTVLIRTDTDAKQVKHKKALDNIQTLISDYRYYRHESENGKHHK